MEADVASSSKVVVNDGTELMEKIQVRPRIRNLRLQAKRNHPMSSAEDYHSWISMPAGCSGHSLSSPKIGMDTLSVI